LHGLCANAMTLVPTGRFRTRAILSPPLQSVNGRMRKEAIKTAELGVNQFVASNLICSIGIDGIIAGICLDVRFVALRLGCLAAIILLPGRRAARGRPQPALRRKRKFLRATLGQFLRAFSGSEAPG
jgi:hypothetical protein